MTNAAAGNSCAVNTLGDIPAQTQRTATDFRSEAELEAAIKAASDRMCVAPTREGKMREWREMCALIDQRTPSRRRFMERTQGLR